MTVEQFMEENCVLCGTQSCLCHLGIPDTEGISYCGRYQGDIEGIEKVRSIMDVLKDWEENHKEVWEEIKQRYENKK